MIIHFLKLALLSLPFLSTFTFAQSNAESNSAGEKQVEAILIETAPLIDGVLDEDVWQLAQPITDFHQILPGDGTEPSEGTEVYILYTEDALYIGARMRDSNPDLISAPTIRHGQGLGDDDRLVVILDPFNTRRTGYRFETNLNSVRHDALYQSVNSFSGDWSTIWDVASKKYENGWIAEIEIPFKSLPFDPNTETWGFNFGRGIRRRGEEMAWVSFNRTYNPGTSGSLTGMKGMNQGLGLDIVPSFSMTSQKDFDNDTSATNQQPSLDAFYRLTPSLNAALTINTDFSATEVDNRQVNLTRFNLFFPEKRDFFLNDSDLFQFGNIGRNGNGAMSRPSQENARPYFSRKLGLGPGGVPVDINYGGRVSGRVGRWNLGTLAIRQDEFGELDASTLFIGRLSANVLQESNVGIILTEGNPTSNIDNSVVGVDFSYLNTRLANGLQLEGDAWYQQSDTPGLDGNDAAFGLGIRSPNNAGIQAGLAYKEVQKNFNPAMGFVNRADIQDYAADIGYTHFFQDSYLQSNYVGIEAQRINQIDGDLQSQAIKFSLVELVANTADVFIIKHTMNQEVVQDPFIIYSAPGNDVIIQPGDYKFSENTIGLRSGGQRQISAGIIYSSGDFYDGDRDNVNLSFDWNQSRFLKMGLSFEWNQIDLPQGEFITRLSSISSQVAFSSTLFWVSLLQYDNVSELLGINTRLQWIPKAGQESFIVLNYGLQDRDKDNHFQAANSDLSIKFKYTFRY